MSPSGAVTAAQELGFARGDLEAVADVVHNVRDIGATIASGSFAACAWYHKVLPSPPASLDALLEDARRYALGPYTDALLKGDSLTDAERRAVAEKLRREQGLSYDPDREIQGSKLVGLGLEHGRKAGEASEQNDHIHFDAGDSAG